MMMKKGIAMTLVAAAIASVATVGAPRQASAASVPVAQANVRYVDTLPNQPFNYSMIDWNQRARNFDAAVFDFASTGTYKPIALWDVTHANMATTTFKLPSYVGPQSPIPDGGQEAVAGMASVLGGALTGIDKSNQTGSGYANVNFADMTRTYLTSEGVINNNPLAKTAGVEFWYVLLPTLTFAGLDHLYPSTAMDAALQTTANSWYDAIVKMGGSNVNFNYLGYDFGAKAPFTGNRTEPDAAIGAGMLEYWAYKKFGTQNYLNAAKWSMNFLQNLTSNPSYEALEYWGPLLASRLNAEQGGRYDVGKMMNWAFDTDSGHRPTWGGLNGTFGTGAMDGLMGSNYDHGGNYAFTMNTFAAGMGIVPVARYDQRYARAIGKWMLNAASNARLFYSDQIGLSQQDSTFWTGDPNHGIPYEGLRFQKIGDSTKAPFATGDPLTYGWPYNTNYGIYSGALSGVFGGTVKTTNVSQILQLDLLKTDFFHDAAYPSYLYYNPYATSQSVNVNVGSAPVDIYDAVTDAVLKTNVTGTQSVSLPADSAAVLVLAPANGTKTYSGGRILIDNVFVGYRPSANLALGMNAVASSTQNGNAATGVTDGTTAVRWESGPGDPQWVYVDLGASKTVGSVVLNWEAAYASGFKIQTSTDAANWTDVYTTTAGTGGMQTIRFAPVNARYVRMYGTARGTQYAYSIYEFEVYAPSNLALGKPATASSTVNGNTASGVTDGTTAYRWESGPGDPQWVSVDLGSPQEINRAIVRWEAAYASAFKLQTSTDGTNWTDVYTTTTGSGGVQNLLFAPVTARYVRMYGTARGTQYAYSIYDLEVYAPTNVALGKAAAASSTTNGNLAKYVTDGTTAYRWESGPGDPQWVSVDLGVAQTIRRAVVKWEAAYASSYKLQVSSDGSNWTDVYSTTTFSGGTAAIGFAPVTARYVRMYGIARGTQYAYSIYDMEVYDS
ncbi:discoidin domain-containing protein [Cohnella sp. 56]|uniref:discoidin domain-containing protein n=1 Tax=Cohnella sp. 56 TaxID=3113722 RepID=UPI0030E947B0